MGSTEEGKGKHIRMMSMTNQAQRSPFLYLVQRTIKLIATIPRSAKPRGAKKFHIAP
jgi:hypothetical protein